jgi:hypothetical protein
MSDIVQIEQTFNRPFRIRPNEYDVTGRVCVSSASEVRDAVQAIFREVFPGCDFDPLWMAFYDFERLFSGSYEDYFGCDTVYHDIQHTLDMTLAMARLLAGHEKSVAPADRLGHQRAIIGLIAALFHDAGYIRRRSETAIANGAEFTGQHVTRSAEFLRSYLPRIGLSEHVGIATRVVHFTGYEMSLDDIELDDPKDSLMGHLLGTGDLLAQMADRCYLEKCRDRLYAEFVLGNVAVHAGSDGPKVLYGSGLDLLRQTPQFIASTIENRLGKAFGHAYRHVEPLYGGDNPYMNAIRQNVDYLQGLMRGSRWPMLRRNPPVFTVDPDAMSGVRTLLLEHLKEVWKSPPARINAG